MARHLTSVMDFTAFELEAMFQEFGSPTATLEAEEAFWQERKSACQGKILVTVFLQPSTRTRTGFMASIMRMGGNVIPY